MHKFLFSLSLLFGLSFSSYGKDPLSIIIKDPAQRAFADTIITHYDHFISSQFPYCDKIENKYARFFAINSSTSDLSIYTPSALQFEPIDSLMVSAIEFGEICNEIANCSSDDKNAQFFHQLSGNLASAGDFSPSAIAMIVKSPNHILWTPAERYVIYCALVRVSMYNKQ